MMPFLVWGLLLAIHASVTSTEESSFNITGLNSDLVKKIIDMHAKVLDIWTELGQRQEANATEMHAVCRVQPSGTLAATEQSRVTGLVLFRQLVPGAKLEAYFDMEGFPAEPNTSTHAVHVHQFGDLSPGCESTGPHYNPRSTQHPKHPGDFGNFLVQDGRLWKHRTDLEASLAGPHSILGRAVVVHAGKDDMGRGGNQASLENGNAGRRLSCCVVSACSPEVWKHHAQERRKRRRESECKSP